MKIGHLAAYVIKWLVDGRQLGLMLGCSACQNSSEIS